MRSNNRRGELHSEAEELAMQTTRWLQSDHPNVYTQLRLERLNILICALDLETESLGRYHPAVGFTLLKKGELHLEMMHVDMAIKDTRDAVGSTPLGDSHSPIRLVSKAITPITAAIILISFALLSNSLSYQIAYHSYLFHW